jgi:hypothetical protein
VLEAEIGAGPAPKLSSSSSTAGGATRTWTSVGDFLQEVALARICDGVHYRFSTEVATAMGKKASLRRGQSPERSADDGPGYPS